MNTSEQTFSIDNAFVVRTLQDLVRINSINPSLSPGGKGEVEIGIYVSNLLQTLGLEVTTYALAPGRLNVVGRLPGAGSGRSLILNAHMDTVGVDGMSIDPFAAEIRENRVYGRGAQDMKGSLAAMIGAAKALVDSGIELGGDLLVTAVADEEYLSIGTEDLVQRVTADAAIVTEPTDMSICRAHRGFIWYDVETFGRAAHGSRFREGIDANMRMGRMLAKLEELEQELRGRPGHPLAGPPSLHAALLHGGSEISVYAAHCLLQMERRTVPGETESEATAEFQAIIDRLTSEDDTFRATATATFLREPFEVGPEATVVRVLENAVTARLNHPPAHTGQTFWTDAAIFAAAGIETVLLGPTGYGLHSAEEWVDIKSVLDLSHILAQAAVDYCR